LENLLTWVGGGGVRPHQDKALWGQGKESGIVFKNYEKEWEGAENEGKGKVFSAGAKGKKGVSIKSELESEEKRRGEMRTDPVLPRSKGPRDPA